MAMGTPGTHCPVVHQRSENEAPRGGLRVLEGGRAERGEMQDPADDAFIDAFERGEPAACEELYDRLIGTVEGTLRRILGRRDRHYDDLVQSSFEQIVRTLTAGRFARACSLKTWAASVTSHMAFNELRRRTRERLVIGPSLEPSEEHALPSPALNVEDTETIRQVLARIRWHLADMNEKRASTIFLHDVLGHDLAEIAVLEGVSVPAAQSRLFRGRKELQGRLAREGWFLAREGGDS
jgi:RNA polymerase sigma-70 factor (ECF subfamily)